MPGNETDGCEPDVSPFEIATQSWKTFNLVYNQTHDPEWLTERDNVEHLAIAYEPKNMIDLNWKIQFLSTVNRAKYAAQINKLIDQLYSYETPKADGPIPLTRKPSLRISSPITRCWPWPRQAGALRPTNIWRAPSKR